MKFVIVGLGSIGRRHLNNLVSLGEKDIVLCRSHQGTMPDDELAGFPVETTIEAALKHGPDAVVISTPTSMHLDAAIPAAEAGCHILLEKPVSHSMERVSELQSALKSGGGKILVGFQYRFHPTLKIAPRLLSEGRIGRPTSIRSHWGEALSDWHPWEDFRKSYAARKEMGGGVVLTLCHPFDYLNWLFGRPEFVRAHADTVGDLGIDVEDTADVSLRFPGGVTANVHLDYLERPKRHYLAVTGTKGKMHWDDSSGVLTVCREDGSDSESFPPPAGFERNSMFLDEMRHFLAVARGEAEPVCTLDDGITALEIALKVLTNPRG